jgi:hypothetical protein
MNWFKFYGQDWLTDIKVLRLSIEDRLCYLTLLCLAAASDDPGLIKKCDEEAIIELSHIPFDPCDTDNPFERAKGFLKRLNDNAMITFHDNGDVTVNNFMKRQGQSLTGYERVKKYREKQRKLASKVIKDNVHDNVGDNTRLDKSRLDKKKPPTPFSSFKKFKIINAGKKPFYQGYEIREAQGRLWCLPKDDGEWLEFVGKESEITWK